MNPKWIADHFAQIQGMLLIGFIILGYFTWKKSNPGSKFKVRESDQPLSNRIKENIAPTKKNEPPKFLPGVRLHGEPHEVLGIREGADEVEVNRAFKELMKKYHPDKIQSVAPDQQKFYQDAATQINRAKEKMIDSIRKKSGR